MSSVKRWAEENGLFQVRSQIEQDQYYDDDELIGYRFPKDWDIKDKDVEVQATEAEPKQE